MVHAFGGISLGSFLGTLFVIAFLELQTRKIDSADEVMGDLGLSVVGSLPMLPARARRNGVMAHQEKDRYWYSLLLESIDATRTMLIHAAHSGSPPGGHDQPLSARAKKDSLASHLATSLARFLALLTPPSATPPSAMGRSGTTRRTLIKRSTGKRPGTGPACAWPPAAG